MQQQQQSAAQTHQESLQIEGCPQPPHELQKQEHTPLAQQLEEEHGRAEKQGQPLPGTQQWDHQQEQPQEQIPRRRGHGNTRPLSCVDKETELAQEVGSKI
ncbi:hypothetical protein Vretifemale_15411 [Volvox reticuliferus]|uniref:Uncharacterized protein n=2 Tax=Volvox reticuliferus TaxID=1737510 RepID=A0A8J4FSN7_9CHLO|nr:hypothetical protein Vretifemale_15411 [Volvox reticuliferus]